MSVNALIVGAVEFLRFPTAQGGLGLGTNECDEQAEGKPPPMAPQRYYAVYDLGSSNDQDEYVHEVCGLAITITIRTPFVPRDREQITVRQYIRRLAEELKVIMIRGEHLLRIQANTHIDGTLNNFVEPLRYRRTSQIETRGPDWFWAEASEGDPQTGVSITLTFESAVRAQSIDTFGGQTA